MLTDEQIVAAIAPLYTERRVAQIALATSRNEYRAVESAACKERDARIAELEKDCDRFERYWNEAMATHRNIAELERELEEAKKDAERYRRIVSACESDGFGYWLPEICLKEGNIPPSKEESDAAIDAALKDQTWSQSPSSQTTPT